VGYRIRAGDLMSADEVGYRLHAARCVELAERICHAKDRLALLAMAKSWLALAEQAVKNSETVLVYETPMPKQMP
jgi:hypothetical protein